MTAFDLRTQHRFSIVFESGRPYMRLSYKAAGERWNMMSSCYDALQLRWRPLLVYLSGITGGIPCRRRIGVLHPAGPYFASQMPRSCVSKPAGKAIARVWNLWTFSQSVGPPMHGAENRVKFWKGHPTKRYAKFLKKIGSLNNRFAHPILSGEAHRKLVERLK